MIERHAIRELDRISDALALDEALRLLERVAERCICEDPDNAMYRFITEEPILDDGLVPAILSFLSKIRRHP
jgi:hypothetical protein